jgi:ElaB/YqjD/DUF883 family membrane-anchored ribosome-binding protein
MNEATQELRGVCDRTTRTLAGLRRTARAIAQSASDKARITARAADHYVHDSPWSLIGAAALVAAALGYVLGRR